MAHPPLRPTRSSSGFERWLLRRTLAARGNPPIEVTLWDGSVTPAPEDVAEARVRLNEPSVLRDLVLRADPGLPEAYVDGRLEVEGELVRLIEALYRAGGASRWMHPLGRLIGFASALRRHGHARENVHSHYDVGNDFYRLWLDEQLLYTCAYFPTQETGLEAAQIAKMDHVCRKLDLRPGERVVEAGCGWGSLALHMAEHFGVSVRAFNLSHEQIGYAREQARRRGLDGRVEFIEDDSRNISGRYDAFMSVGMLEHMGKRDFRTLSHVIERSLEPHGRGLIHSIGRVRAQPMSVWIEREIFPGAYIPALKEMMDVFEPNRLAVLDVENLRLHYARTLELWLERFEKASDRIEQMFDAHFVRTWRMYLSISIASFRVGGCQLFQIVFSRQANDAIPWTRAGVYRER